MNWRRDSTGFMKRLIPARFLVHLVHFRHIGLISEALYDKLFRPLTITRQSLKEQL